MGTSRIETHVKPISWHIDCFLETYVNLFRHSLAYI